ncbi:MAG: hypothetical protein ACI9O3_000885, partial [Colwellia sp.]
LNLPSEYGKLIGAVVGVISLILLIVAHNKRVNIASTTA